MKIHAPSRTIVAGTYGLSSYKSSLDDLMTGVSPHAGQMTTKLAVNPNPVETSTTLQFYLPAGDRIVIRAYGINGTPVQEIFSGSLKQGRQEITWRPGDIPAGVYLVRIEGNRYSATAKIVRR
jgi:hypothetical protein